MSERSKRKMFVGDVVSDKMDKSITVQIQRKFRHPFYGKYVTKSSKFMAHDEKNESHTGDKVRIMEVRPLSRRKRWRLVEIVKKAQ